MAKLINIEINNYKGIKSLSLDLKIDSNLICFIGRGDSGKTTILNAISTVLSPNWNMSFDDTDFYNCDHNKNITIVASLIDFPESLLSEHKFGLYIRGYNYEVGKIVEDLLLEEMNDKLIPVLTIKLTVNSTLEPAWVVMNSRNSEDKQISASDASVAKLLHDIRLCR